MLEVSFSSGQLWVLTSIILKESILLKLLLFLFGPKVFVIKTQVWSSYQKDVGIDLNLGGKVFEIFLHDFFF